MNVLNKIWPWSEIKRLKERLAEAQKNDTRDATGRFTKKVEND